MKRIFYLQHVKFYRDTRLRALQIEITHDVINNVQCIGVFGLSQNSDQI